MLAIISLVVIQVVVFVVLVLIWRKIMTGQVSHATTHLQQLGQDYLKKHEELKDRLSEGDKRYQDQVEAARAEAERLRAQTLQEADAARERLLADAKAEGEKIVNQAIAAREVMKQELEAALSQRAVVHARRLVEAILPEAMRQVMQAQWVEELITQGLKGLPKLDTPQPVREVRVVSAFALNTAQRQKLQARLSELAGQPVTLQESVEAQLLAGLMITAGDLVLDGTLASKLDQAARSLPQ